MKIYNKNRSIERETSRQFYIIETEDEYGVRKYVSKDYPRLYQRTTKLAKAKRFDLETAAEAFIEDFKDYKKCPIRNPKIKLVKQSLCVTE